MGWVTSKDYRRAKLDDIAKVVALVSKFYQKSGGVYDIPLLEDSLYETVFGIIDQGIVIIGPSSCAGAYVVPWPFNRTVTIAQILFWYFEKPHEIAIFDQLVHHCRKAGATHINVAALAPRMTGKNFYETRKMRLAESHFIGVIQ